ncbi:MAG: TldD/PmbA family protein [Candidatus Methanospirareceae archaeon]
MDFSYIVDAIKADYVEVRVEESFGEKVRYIAGRIEDISFFEDKEVGIRALKNGSWVISHTTDISKVEKLIEHVKRGVELLPKGDVKIAYVEGYRKKREIKRKEVPLRDKMDFLGEIQSPLVSDFLIWGASMIYSEITEHKRILTSEGIDVEQKIPYTLLKCSINTAKTLYVKNFGVSGGFEALDKDRIKKEIERMHEVVLKQLHNKAIKNGTYTVVMGPSLTGSFIEEVVGHPAEGDFIVEGKSPFKGLKGEKIAPEWVTIVDDPSFRGSFAYANFDDEGVTGRRKEIIKEGVLNEFIYDRESAARLREEPNGGGRGEVGMLPSPRISTLYLERGDMEEEELLSIPFGIYADGAAGGYVSIPDGEFQINAQEGYMIEKGKLTHSLGRIAIKGKIMEALSNIEAVGKDFSLENVGLDLKKGQMVSVSSGGPSIRVSGLFVGQWR